MKNNLLETQSYIPAAQTTIASLLLYIWHLSENKIGKIKKRSLSKTEHSPNAVYGLPLVKMFICADIFRWASNANAPFLMLIFRRVHWLHLLVFIKETTTKNLQLLQTWVTSTLWCVWLRCVYTFLAEEMKRRQAAGREPSCSSELEQGDVPAVPREPEPAVSPPQRAPEPAGNEAGTMLHVQPNERSPFMSPSDLGQDEVRDTPICWRLCQWLANLASLQTYSSHTLISYLRKLPDAINTDFNSRKMIQQKGIPVFMQILTAEPTPRTPVSARPLLLYQKD